MLEAARRKHPDTVAVLASCTASVSGPCWSSCPCSPGLCVQPVGLAAWQGEVGERSVSHPARWHDIVWD